MDTEETSVPAAAAAEPKIAAEVAEAEFARFVEAMDLDVDPAGMDDEDKASFQNAKRRVLKAMMAGHLVVNGDDEPVYTPRKGNTSPITFYEPTGASIMAQDGKKKGHEVAKTYATLADMTRTNSGRFAGMKSRDLKVCTDIMVLFLG